jgi:hypothetical protein
MQKKITGFIRELKTNKKLATFDEASTKQAVVLRLLSFLGWDIFNVEEVSPNYSVGDSSVSYALRIENISKIFIDVKIVHKSQENYQQELVNLGMREEVYLAILTNGVTWWLHLIDASGNWQQKWFYTIDILKQKSDAFVSHLIDLLAKENVDKGQSLKAAQTILQEKKQKMAADFLPEAWNRIITQPNKIFVELLSETTEKLCQYKVDAKTVEKFLRKHNDSWVIKKTPRSSTPSHTENGETTQILDLDKLLSSSMSKDRLGMRSAKSMAGTDTLLSKTDTIKLSESYMDKSIKSFSFNSNTYKIESWVEMLTTLCDYFASANKKEFEKVLWISNDQKPRFSRYGDQLRIPEKVKRTDIYVETKLNPDEVVKTSCKLLAEFGYSKDDLDIEVK